MTLGLSGPGSATPPACPECPLVDVMERKASEARMAAWAGVLVTILGVVSWTTLGFAAGGVGAIALGLYARTFAPRESYGALTGGGLALAVLALRLLDLL